MQTFREFLKTKFPAMFAEDNPWHKEDGTLGSPRGKGSWSLQFISPGPGSPKKARAGKIVFKSKTPCGRRARQLGQNIRCQD